MAACLKVKLVTKDDVEIYHNLSSLQSKFSFFNNPKEVYHLDLYNVDLNNILLFTEASYLPTAGNGWIFLLSTAHYLQLIDDRKLKSKVEEYFKRNNIPLYCSTYSYNDYIKKINNNNHVTMLEGIELYKKYGYIGSLESSSVEKFLNRRSGKEEEEEEEQQSSASPVPYSGATALPAGTPSSIANQGFVGPMSLSSRNEIKGLRGPQGRQGPPGLLHLPGHAHPLPPLPR